jgi:hypothetical protein
VLGKFVNLTIPEKTLVEIDEGNVTKNVGENWHYCIYAVVHAILRKVHNKLSECNVALYPRSRLRAHEA